MNNKLVIAIAALMVAALAAPAVMAADVSYSASVVASDVSVITNNAAFGSLLSGTTNNEITGSLNLTNSGGAAADVDAKFTTDASGTHGLVSGTDVIGGSNFRIGTDGNEVVLSDSNTDTALGSSNQIPASGSVDYDAILDVPSGQAPGVYSGTVQLTFISV